MYALSAPIDLPARGDTRAGLVSWCARLQHGVRPAAPQTKAAEPCLDWLLGSASGKAQLQPSGLGGQPAEGFGVGVRGHQQLWGWRHGAPVGYGLMSKKTMKLSQHSPSACTPEVTVNKAWVEQIGSRSSTVWLNACLHSCLLQFTNKLT